MTSELGRRSVGPRVSLRSFDEAPDGVFEGKRGDLGIVNTDPPSLWQNTDGSDGWEVVASGTGTGGPAATCWVQRGSDQAVSTPSGTPVKVLFTAKAFDVGSHYDLATNRYTPPAGYYTINAAVSTNEAALPVNAKIQAILYKNGAEIARGTTDAAGAAETYLCSTVAATVNANGTDYFELYVAVWGTASWSIDGATSRTHFSAAIAVGGDGDIIGPASSTDEAVARWDGTTGKLLQDGTATLDDSGNLDLAAGNLITSGLVDGVDVSAHDHSGGDNGEKVPDTSIEIFAPPASPFATLRDALETIVSAGTNQGAYITDGGGGTIDVGAVYGYMRKTDSPLGVLASFVFGGSTGHAIPSGEVRFVGIEYNGGSYQASLKSADTWNGHDEFRLGSVANEGGTLHIVNSPKIAIDALERIEHRFFDTRPLEYASRLGGLRFGETGTRNLTLTEGELYDGLTEHPITAKDTSGSDTFDAYYRDGGSGWTKVSAQTQWDNQKYDDGSGTLQFVSVGQYGVHWLYLEADDTVVSVYGQGNYATLADAQEAQPPASLPLRLTPKGHAALGAKVIYQRNAGTLSQIDSAFEQVFSGTGVVDHAELSNLQGGAAGEKYHTTAEQNASLAKVGTWSFATATGTPPADAQVRLNNATQSSATAINVDDNADNGVDMGVVFGLVVTGSVILLQQNNDPTRYHLFVASGPATDQSGYWSIPVTHGNGGSDLQDGATTVVRIFASNATIWQTYTFPFADGAVVASDTAVRDLIVGANGTIKEVDIQCTAAPTGTGEDKFKVEVSGTSDDPLNFGTNPDRVEDTAAQMPNGDTRANTTTIANAAVTKGQRMRVTCTGIAGTTAGEDYVVAVLVEQGLA